jgi:hypothetical protein
VDHDVYDDYVTTSALGNAEGFLDNTVFEWMYTLLVGHLYGSCGRLTQFSPLLYVEQTSAIIKSACCTHQVLSYMHQELKTVICVTESLKV